MAKEIKKIEIVGPPGRIVIKESDLQRYLSKGYKLLVKANVKDSLIPATGKNRGFYKKMDDSGV